MRLLVEFEVQGRPVPWKAPFHPRGGRPFSPKPLKDYQKYARAVAQLAWVSVGGAHAYARPVGLELTFRMTRKKSMPDLTNLVKCFEDAVKGVVFTDDRLVLSQDNLLQEVDTPEEEGVTCRVFALKEPEPGWTDSMLVLGRGPEQEVLIYHEGPGSLPLRVKVLAAYSSGRVDLGFTAPKHIPVHRAEVAEASGLPR